MASLRAFYTPTHKRLTGRGERSVNDRSANMPHSISRSTFAVFRLQEMYYKKVRNLLHYYYICKHTWYGSVLLYLQVCVYACVSDVTSLVLRPTFPEQDRSQTKKIGLGLGLAGLVLCCETRSCYARRHNDLEGHSNFSSTIYNFSILCLEHHYCGLWRSTVSITYLRVKSAKCLCLLPVVLVLT